jgi:hypothetical protein
MANRIISHLAFNGTLRTTSESRADTGTLKVVVAAGEGITLGEDARIRVANMIII